MNGQQFTRRMVLGAFTVALALPGLGARASVDDGGFYDKAQFKGTCEENGGTFTDTEDGNTWCQWDDDSQTVCDDDGQDCHDIPSGNPLPPGGDHAAPGDITGADPSPDGGSDPPPADNPSVEPPTEAPTDSPSVAAPDDDQDQDTSKSKKSKKGKKGKKHGHGGKGHKK